MLLEIRLVPPGSTKFGRLTASSVREEFASMCAYAEPDGTDVCAVHVARGGQTWSENVQSHL